MTHDWNLGQGLIFLYGIFSPTVVVFMLGVSHNNVCHGMHNSNKNLASFPGSSGGEGGLGTRLVRTWLLLHTSFTQL